MFERVEANELANYEPHGSTKGAECTVIAGKKCETSAKVVSRGKKLLIVSLSSLLSNFFAEKALVTSCMLKNSSKIKTTALLNTGVTGYLFIDPSMIHRMCDELQIEPIRLSKPKAIQSFNGQ